MTENRKSRLIEIARAMTDKRTGRSFHVSFILDKNKIVSIGWNNYLKSHPKSRFGEYKATRHSTPSYYPGLHAEISSLSRLLNNSEKVPDFKRLAMFNVRIGFNGEVMNAKCCKNCQRTLEEIGFRNFHWTE